MKLEENEILAPYTTFRIGGRARYFITVTCADELKEALMFCKKHQLRYLILGKGSNILFDDQGFNGAVILNKIHFMTQEGGLFSTGSGYSFSLLGAQTARKGWTGLEFASGIPGSVGGAVFMNAGANGGQTFDSLFSVTFVSEEGKIETLLKEQIAWGYRWSQFHNRKGAICAAQFALHPSLQAREKQLSLVKYRTSTQPYDEPSAGCVFRNDKNQSAGYLIEMCDLKGKEKGGAKVSLLHANFIINQGNATAADVLTLSQMVQSTVYEKTGIKLEMELRYIPYDDPNG